MMFKSLSKIKKAVIISLFFFVVIMPLIRAVLSIPLNSYLDIEGYLALSGYKNNIIASIYSLLSNLMAIFMLPNIPTYFILSLLTGGIRFFWIPTYLFPTPRWPTHLLVALINCLIILFYLKKKNKKNKKR